MYRVRRGTVCKHEGEKKTVCRSNHYSLSFMHLFTVDHFCINREVLHQTFCDFDHFI